MDKGPFNDRVDFLLAWYVNFREMPPWDDTQPGGFLDRWRDLAGLLQGLPSNEINAKQREMIERLRMLVVSWTGLAADQALPGLSDTQRAEGALGAIKGKERGLQRLALEPPDNISRKVSFKDGINWLRSRHLKDLQIDPEIGATIDKILSQGKITDEALNELRKAKLTKDKQEALAGDAELLRRVSVGPRTALLEEGLTWLKSRGLDDALFAEIKREGRITDDVLTKLRQSNRAALADEAELVRLFMDRGALLALMKRLPQREARKEEIRTLRREITRALEPMEVPLANARAEELKDWNRVTLEREARRSDYGRRYTTREAFDKFIQQELDTWAAGEKLPPVTLKPNELEETFREGYSAEEAYYRFAALKAYEARSRDALKRLYKEYLNSLADAERAQLPALPTDYDLNTLTRRMKDKGYTAEGAFHHFVKLDYKALRAREEMKGLYADFLEKNPGKGFPEKLTDGQLNFCIDRMRELGYTAEEAIERYVILKYRTAEVYAQANRKNVKDVLENKDDSDIVGALADPIFKTWGILDKQLRDETEKKLKQNTQQLKTPVPTIEEGIRYDLERLRQTLILAGRIQELSKDMRESRALLGLSDKEESIFVRTDEDARLKADSALNSGITIVDLKAMHELAKRIRLLNTKVDRKSVV